MQVPVNYDTETRFNPRARDGRERKEPLPNMDIAVSIHAPVMDAKIQIEDYTMKMDVSIHAPVMDAKYLHYL